MIKVTKISGPTHREIIIRCPHCKARLSRNVPLDAKKGNDKCGICGTTFIWEETEKEVLGDI